MTVRGEAGRPSIANYKLIHAFASLWALLLLARTFLHTVVPLQAYSLLGDAQFVSLIYFLAGLAGVAGSLSLPMLVCHLRRDRVVLLGACAMVCACALFSTVSVPGLAAGLVLQVWAVAAFDVSMTLYLLEHVPRAQLLHYEPLRAFYSAVAFTVGPVTGVWCWDIAPKLPFAVAALIALGPPIVILLFRWSTQTQSQQTRPLLLNPLVYLPRFFRQPRLRLAYVLASIRSAWWAMFSIYSPIFVVQMGYDSIVAGVVVSVGFSFLFLSPLWGAVARSFGVRRVLFFGYIVGGLITLFLVGLGETSSTAITILLLAALVVSTLDGVGNVLFLRAVRPLERSEMSTVFGSFREVGHTVAPGVLAALLRVFDLSVVFFVGGASLLIAGWYARFIPRRM